MGRLQQQTLKYPDNLYIIGTMNLIDQSLEQVDFALRRRFLWFPLYFSDQELLSILKTNGTPCTEAEPLGGHGLILKRISSRLVDRATAINQEIQRHQMLGSQFQIGHAYF